MKITDLNPDVLGMVRDKRALTRLKIRSGSDIEALDWTKIFQSGPILLRKTKTRGPLRVTSIHDFEGNDYLKNKAVRVVSRKKSGDYDMVVDIYDPMEPEFPERSRIRVDSSMVFFDAPRSSRASASKKKRRSRKKDKKTEKAKKDKKARKAKKAKKAKRTRRK